MLAEKYEGHHYLFGLVTEIPVGAVMGLVESDVGPPSRKALMDYGERR